MGLRSHNVSTLSGLGAIFLWSTTFAFARSVSEQVGPLTTGAAAYLAGGMFCLLQLGLSPKPMDKLRGLSPAYLLGCGSLFVFYTAAIYLAVGLAKSRAQVLEVALVNYLWPALTILFSLPLLKQRANLWLLPGTVLALAGVFLVMTQGARVSWGSIRDHVLSNPAAYGLALAAAIAWALYSNLARRWSNPQSGGAVEIFVPVTGLVLLGMRFLVSEPSNWTVRAVWEVAGLATVTTVAYILWDFAMRRGKVAVVAACSYFTPLLSTMVNCAYLQVAPGAQVWLGCVLLIGGSLLTWRSVSEAK